MRELCLHILDIAVNSISAGADKIIISIDENLKDDTLTIEIIDNGKGMNSETLKMVTDPFVTSRTERNVGLGIPMLKFAAESCNGWFKIDSDIGKGTKVTVQFQHSHVDRMPLGNIPDTLLSLILCTPEVNWVYSIRKNDKEFYFDDTELKKELDGIPLTDPEVIRFIRKIFEEGIQEVQN
ncbi:MAG: ATP-binding protein [Chloroflexota bacterium]|nr:ATP-binding protein [Chloroflexota bacterium]